MQKNDPRTRLDPSRTYVARDVARDTVARLKQLQAYSQSLMDGFVGWCRTGHPYTLTPDEYTFLVRQSLLRADAFLEDHVKDVVLMTVSGESAPFTIDGSVFS